MIMRKLCILCVAALAVLAASCSRASGNSNGTFQHLSFASNGDVIAHARDGSNARIDATGDLAIQGRQVPVTPAQRQLLQTYHSDAIALRNDAIATGKAGMQTGLHALDAVAKGLASGHPDSIDSEVDSRASKVDALAKTVCTDLGRLYAAQGGITNAIPVFGPYATIEQHDVSDCRND